MKKLFTILLALVLFLTATACGSEEEYKYDPTENFAVIQWPNSALAQRLPSPNLNYGEFKHEREDSFCIYFGNVTREKFDEYVEQCKEAGYDAEPHITNTVYWSYDAEGYYLYLRYDEEYSMMDIETRCPNKSKATMTTTTTATTDSLGSDFKAAMDAYETFMNQYVDFMKKYQENPTDLSLLADYATYMSDYAKFCDEFSKWEDEELNTAELAYYTEVQARVTKKLLEVAG